jgi:hypothetical protein
LKVKSLPFLMATVPSLTRLPVSFICWLQLSFPFAVTVTFTLLSLSTFFVYR